VFKREERKKAGKCARGIFVLMTKPMKKRFLKGNSSLIVIGSKDYGSNPKRKEKTSGVTNTRPLSLKGLFFFWQRESGVGVSQGVVIERL
jgi:hypothetical protein